MDAWPSKFMVSFLLWCSKLWCKDYGTCCVVWKISSFRTWTCCKIVLVISLSDAFLAVPAAQTEGCPKGTPCILGSLTTGLLPFIPREVHRNSAQLDHHKERKQKDYSPLTVLWQSFIWHDASIFSDRERPPWESVSSPCNHEGGSCWVTWLLFQSQHKSYSSFRD